MEETATDLYPTRGEDEWILERPDPVVFGSGEKQSPYGLAPEEVESYEKNGFLLLPGTFPTNEIGLFLEEYEHLRTLPKLQRSEELVREPDSDTVRSVFNLHRHSELFEQLSRDRRILDKVTQLLGSRVYRHHDRINIKPAFAGRAFFWHSDFETWHAEDGIPNCRMLTASIMLTENNEFNGPLYVVPGSHNHFISCAGKTPEQYYKASLRQQKHGVPSAATVRTLVEEGGITGVHGAAGTLVFHEGNILHGSADNISPWPRIDLMFVYNSIENTPLAKPFAAAEARPEFLRSTDFTPLDPVDNRFI